MAEMQPRRRSVWLKAGLGALAALVLVGVALTLVVGLGMRSFLHEVYTPLPEAAAAGPTTRPVREGDRINVLVLGVDDDYLRSDTIILASIDPGTGGGGASDSPRHAGPPGRARHRGKGQPCARLRLW